MRTALKRAAARLRRAGVDTPELDAELLLAHVLGRERSFLFAHPDLALDGAARSNYAAVVRRRAAREPLPYLLGRWEFMGMSFLVTPAVLIPRPETEVLVEALAGRLVPNESGMRILDIGAGSGCVAIGLVSLLPEAKVVALEPSQAALGVARRNAAALGYAARIEFVAGIFPEDARHVGLFDALAANPPYIPSAEVAALQPEIRDYEPREAVDGGPDGLAVLRPLATEGPDMLVPGGWLATEVALGQAERVVQLLQAEGRWEAITTVPDLAGIPRVVLARRRVEG
ncbi:MAG: peptide chain release factor N(5)-glutamine methyltransferase [Armatimonadetes bacterium]|nr:peptide chain release factor N(5)-glutamine methyltransferase [Armatimonadota bacterium]